MPVITFDMLNHHVIARLIDAGAASEHARIVAESLTYAEASGIVSHGLVRLPFLLEQTRTGKIDGTAEPELRATSSGLLVCDARHGYGYVAAHHTVTSMIASLHSGAGFVLASISNSHHFGVAGQWAERLAEQGFVGLVTSSTFGAIAPLGNFRKSIACSWVANHAGRSAGGGSRSCCSGPRFDCGCGRARRDDSSRVGARCRRKSNN
jgi:(2R)-3-sulfolactate dehydrogenase (NADP+)